MADTNNVVIVAIPAADDRVWKISSEKIPHLTLLFLGPAETVPELERITKFVEHTVTVCEHGEFMLRVDYRDMLGEDNADVVFFEKGDYSFKWIEHFRSVLLQQNNIRDAYEKADQFPEWQPHLTLGYPESPAKEDNSDYGLHWVTFDRIAVWTGNYEGPEFRLKWPEREGDLAVAYSELVETGAEALEHFGVKGMRWGQRKDTQVTVGGKSKMVTAKKAAKLDKQWEKNIYSVPGAIAMHNAMADHFNARIGALNDKHDVEFTDAHWDDHTRKSWSPEQKAYMDAVDKLTEEGYRQAVTEVHGTSPTGTKRAKLSDDGEDIIVVNVNDQVKHAATTEEPVAVLKITRNAKGLITRLTPLITDESELAQAAMDRGAEFLEHFGIKGMHWGVRKSRPAPTAVPTKAMAVVPHGAKRKTQIKVEGGENHPAHEDAIKVAEARVKLQKSGTAALSNNELREVATRLQLEQQVKTLTTSSGQKFVKSLLTSQAESSAKSFLRSKDPNQPKPNPPKAKAAAA